LLNKLNPTIFDIKADIQSAEVDTVIQDLVAMEPTEPPGSETEAVRKVVLSLYEFCRLLISLFEALTTTEGFRSDDVVAAMRSLSGNEFTSVSSHVPAMPMVAAFGLVITPQVFVQGALSLFWCLEYFKNLELRAERVGSLLRAAEASDMIDAGNQFWRDNGL
jgi:hypothetical protein